MQGADAQPSRGSDGVQSALPLLASVLCTFSNCLQCVSGWSGRGCISGSSALLIKAVASSATFGERLHSRGKGRGSLGSQHT